jgi:hypothetical protein
MPSLAYFQLNNLVLDSGSQGNKTSVTGTASTTFATVNAGTNDQVTASDASETLQGVSPADQFDQKTLGDLLNLDQIILNLSGLTVRNGKLSVP